MRYLPGLAWIKNAAGRYVYANEAALSAFGRGADGVLGRTDAELFPPETAAEFRANDLTAIASGSGIRTIERLRTPDGDVRHSIVSKFVVPAADGRPALVGGIAIDVTDRRRVEERLEAVLQSIDDHLVSYDRQWRFTYVNSKAAEVLRRPASELTGRSIWDVFPDAVGNQYYRELHEAVAAQRVIRSEHYYAGFDRWFENHIYPSAEGVTVFSSDVTWRKKIETERAEAAALVRESEERFRVLAETIPSLVWTASADGSVVYANRSWKAYVGSGPSGPIDGWTDSLHPDDRPRAVARWDEAVRGEAEVELELRLRRHDGEHRWFLTRAVPLRDAAGAVTSWCGVSTDIHDRKEMEERLQEADRRKDAFLATLAHELRNPLAPLRYAVPLLRSGKPEQRDRVLEILDRQVSHMVRLVDDLLEVSRITSGRMELRRRAIDLVGLVRAAVDAVAPLVDTRRHELVRDVPDGPIVVDADPVRLTQVLGNLLHNAATYTPPGGRIVVGVALDEDSAEIRVADNGVGLAADHLPRLFEGLAHAPGSSGRATGGLGIGLSIARRLVEMHGGTIGARSDGLGRGSEFVVRIPLARAGAPCPPHLSARSADEPRLPIDVLVVDDNPDAAQTLAMAVQPFVEDVRVVGDGDSALREMRARVPSVALVDLFMPGVDGFEVASRVRSDPSLGHVVLVAVTGFGQAADLARSKAAGFHHHLVKPAQLDALQAILRTASRMPER